MTEFGLLFAVPEPLSDSDAARYFYWPPAGTGSIETKLSPRLGTIGPVNPLNADLVRLAVMVYLADRSVLRASGSVNWTSRDLRLTVPVSAPDVWTAQADDLTALLGFLSGDSWELAFEKADLPEETAVENRYLTAERVVLLSGGADSAIGAFLARTTNESGHVLVSHYGRNNIGPTQRTVAERIAELAPDGGEQAHIQVGISRKTQQPNGYKFKNEPSTRTRSLLFLSLGLAVASMNEVPLWIPENGFASLNPAMGADQLGSLSTKTTHPWFLTELSRILNVAGVHGHIENPFASQTKGEMFRWLGDQVGDDAAADLLSLTNSCGFTNKRFLKISRKDHCGTCFGCLVRQASFAAAGIEDRSNYVSENPPNTLAERMLRKLSMLPSLSAFVARGVGIGDVAAMRLPDGYSPSAARELCERGVRELSELT